VLVSIDDAAAPHVLHIPGHAVRSSAAISGSLASHNCGWTHRSVSSITPSQKYSDESAGSTELDVVVVEVVEADVPVATADEVDAAELDMVVVVDEADVGVVVQDEEDEDVDLYADEDEDEDEDEAIAAELVVDVDDSAAPHVLLIPGHASRNSAAIPASLASHNCGWTHRSVSSITPSQKYSEESAGSTELVVVVVEVVEAGVPVAAADEVDDAAELVSVAIIILLPGG
jgi:hypothetical protein